jgi:hypothetical protein
MNNFTTIILFKKKNNESKNRSKFKAKLHQKRVNFAMNSPQCSSSFDRRETYGLTSSGSKDQ